MPDLPLPKPPKPAGLAGSSVGAGGVKPPASAATINSKKDKDDLSPPPSRLVVQSGSGGATSTSPLGSLGESPQVQKPTPPATPSTTSGAATKPPAVVTALHSVAPAGIPTGANKPTLDGPGQTAKLNKPVLDKNSKISTPGNAEKKTLKNVSLNQVQVSPPPPPPKPKPNQIPPSASKTPPPAKPKKSFMAKFPYIFGGLAILLVVLVLGFKFLGGKKTTSVTPSSGGNTGEANEVAGSGAGSEETGGQAGQANPAETAELEYWGLWEPESVMAPLIAEFEQSHPGISIRYIKQSPKNYRERLQTAIASGNGPDIFRYHDTWVPMLKDDLAPLPASVMSASEFKNTFYPVATRMLQADGQLVGLPLEYDGLVLFYNQDILAAAGEKPPTSWAQVRSLASKLALRESSKIKRAGIALGTAENTDHFSDILGLLMLQNGADLTQPDSPEVRDALVFYTNFVKTDKVWSQNLPASTLAFARGEAAMLIAPSWRADEIKNINPELKFAATAAPQVTEENDMAWASFWAEGVNKHNKKHVDAAWQFLKFMTEKETQKKFFAEAAKTRMFGEPYARVDLAQELAEDPILGGLMMDAPKAISWYMTSNTFDNGLNDQIVKYYKDAVNALLEGKSIEKVLPTLSQGVSEVLSQYNVTN